MQHHNTSIHFMILYTMALVDSLNAHQQSNGKENDYIFTVDNYQGVNKNGTN